MGSDTIEASTWFAFSGRAHSDPRELAAAIATEWDDARELVLGAGAGRLREFLGRLDLSDVTRDVTEESADICVARLIALLDPLRPPTYRLWTLDADGLSRLVADATGPKSRRPAALAAIEALSDGRILNEYVTAERRWLAALGRDWRQAGEAYLLTMRRVPRPVPQPGRATATAKVTTLQALLRPYNADELAHRASHAADRTVAAETEWFRAMVSAAAATPHGPQRIGALAAVLAAVPVAREDGRQARAHRRAALVAGRWRLDRRLIGWTTAVCATAVAPTAIGYLMRDRRILAGDPRVQPGDRLQPLSRGGMFIVETYTPRYALAMWLAGSAILAAWLAVLLVSRSWRRRPGAIVLALVLVAGSGGTLRVAGRMWTDEEHRTLQRVLHEPYPYRSRYPTCSVDHYVFARTGGERVTWVVGTADTRRNAANDATSCVAVDVYTGWRRMAHVDLPAGEVISTPVIQIVGASPAQSYWAAVVTDAATGKGKYLAGFALATPVSWRLNDPVFSSRPHFVVVGTVAIFDASPRGIVGIDIAKGKRAWARNCPGRTVYGGIIGGRPNGVVIRCSGKRYLVGPNGSIKAA